MNNLSYVSYDCLTIFLNHKTLLAPKNGAWDRFVLWSYDFSPYEITFLTLKFFSIFHQQYSKNNKTNRKLNKDNNDIIVILSCLMILTLIRQGLLKYRFYGLFCVLQFFKIIRHIRQNHKTPFKKEKR